MTSMHVLIVHAHPEPTSYTAALKDAAAHALRSRGHAVVVSDLHAEGFNPVAGRHDFESIADPARFHYQAEQLNAARRNAFAPDLAREQARVAQADLFVFTFPIWWGGLPAILKGWFDRVMAYGFAYADGKRFDQGYFQGRRALMAISTGGTAERFSDDGVYGDIADVLYPVRRCMFEYLGLEVLPPFMAYGAARADDAARRAYLEQWAQAVVGAVDDVAWQARMKSAPAIPALGTDDTGGWTARR